MCLFPRSFALAGLERTEDFIPPASENRTRINSRYQSQRWGSVLSPTIVVNQSAPQRPTDFLLQSFPQWTLAHWCVVVFAFSFLILTILPEGRLNDFEVPFGAESVRVARSLAVRGAFADPFAVMPTGETAHLAPVYPFLYSIILRLFGTGYTALRIAWAGSLACFALQMSLLPLLSYRLNLGIPAGMAAAALGTVSLYAPIDTRWESFFAGTLLLLVCLLTNQAFRDRRFGPSVAAGGLWGLVMLTNPVTVLLFVAWPLCFAFCETQGASGVVLARGSAGQLTEPQNMHRLARIFGIALLVVAPWIVRNYVCFGTFIFVRDNLGLELYTGNNDCASPDLKGNIQSGCHARTHPNPTIAVAAQLAAEGEVPFYRAKLRQAIGWITAHRLAFLHLTLQRFRLFWFPAAERAWESVFAWVVTLVSFPGLFVIARKNRCVMCVIGAAWLLFPLVYYVVPFEPRYRYPIFWTSLLPAGYAVVVIAAKLLPRLAAASSQGSTVLCEHPSKHQASIPFQRAIAHSQKWLCHAFYSRLPGCLER